MQSEIYIKLKISAEVTAQLHFWDIKETSYYRRAFLSLFIPGVEKCIWLESDPDVSTLLLSVCV